MRRPCSALQRRGRRRSVAKCRSVAKKVEKRAEWTEKVEGKHDLVEDAVRTKTGTRDKKVIEQVDEASYYGKDFHGKKTAGGENSTRAT